MKRTFEDECIAEIEEAMKRKPERGVVLCMCCEKYFSSPDRRRIHFCPGCKIHVPNPAFGCPTLLLQEGGVSLSRMRPDPASASNSHLFNARPKCKDKRRLIENIPEEEEIDLFEEDLGVKVFVERDE